MDIKTTPSTPEPRSSHRGASGSAGGGAFGPGSENLAALEQAVTVIGAADRESRLLEARKLRAYAELYAVAEREATSEAPRRIGGCLMARRAVEESVAYRSAVAVVAVDLHVSEHTARSRVENAHELVAFYPATVVALAAGAIEPQHTRVIVNAGRILGAPGVAEEPEVTVRRARYEALVLERGRETSPNQLRPYARRVAEELAEKSLEERHESEKARRRVWGDPADDGMAYLTAYIAAEDAHGIHSRLSRMAKQAQQAETSAFGELKRAAAESDEDTPEDTRRTRDEIRADLLLDLLGLDLTDPQTASDLADRIEAGAGVPAVRGIVQVIVHREHLDDGFGDAGHDRLGAAGRSRFGAAGHDGFDAAGRDPCDATGLDQFDATTHDQFDATTRDGFDAATPDGFDAAGGDRFDGSDATAHRGQFGCAPDASRDGQQCSPAAGATTGAATDTSTGASTGAAAGAAAGAATGVANTARTRLPLPELEGYGPVSVDAARRIAGRADRWVEATVNTSTGDVESVTSRVPSADQKRRLLVRDEHCRWPGCRTPGHRCDIDHTVAVEDGGPTAMNNLGYLCRNHHTLKHHGGWKVRQTEGAVYEWRSPTGRITYTKPESRVRFRSAEGSSEGSPSPPEGPSERSPTPPEGLPLVRVAPAEAFEDSLEALEDSPEAIERALTPFKAIRIPFDCSSASLRSQLETELESSSGCAPGPRENSARKAFARARAGGNVATGPSSTGSNATRSNASGHDATRSDATGANAPGVNAPGTNAVAPTAAVGTGSASSTDDDPAKGIPF